MQKLTVTILSESGDFSDALLVTQQGIENGNRMGRGENDTDSYEWAIMNVYE